MDKKATLHIIDGSTRHRAELARIGFGLGHHCEVYADLSDLSVHPPSQGIILARNDSNSGGISATIERLGKLGIWLPLIAYELQPRPGSIVEAIKAGALDFLALPINEERFERCLARIGQEAEEYGEERRRNLDARARLLSLSGREREVLDLLAMGGTNKAIARQLEISPRTVEIHRANMMNKLGASHAAEAVRLTFEAGMARPERLD